jgi:hypothetical protein
MATTAASPSPTESRRQRRPGPWGRAARSDSSALGSLGALAEILSGWSLANSSRQTAHWLM